MGGCCSSPPDLTQQEQSIEYWTDLFGPGSVWIGDANLYNDETDYLEIKILKKEEGAGETEQIRAQRMTNIAKGQTANSTRFEFNIERVPKKKRKKGDPTHCVIFEYEDSGGMSLRGTILNEEKLKIEGKATLYDQKMEKTFEGSFQLARAMASSASQFVSPRGKKSSSTLKLIEKATQKANSKLASEEMKRQSEIDAKSLKAVARASERFDMNGNPIQIMKRSPVKRRQNRAESSV